MAAVLAWVLRAPSAAWPARGPSSAARRNLLLRAALSGERAPHRPTRRAALAAAAHEGPVPFAALPGSLQGL